MNGRIFYRGGYKYQLAADYLTRIPINPASTIETDWIKLSPAGELAIARGYAWDGPSGPAIDTKSAMRGSLIHDALFQLLRLGHLSDALRPTFDQIYKDACIEDGMWLARAHLHFLALRQFGWWAARPSAERQILTAP